MDHVELLQASRSSPVKRVPALDFPLSVVLSMELRQGSQPDLRATEETIRKFRQYSLRICLSFASIRAPTNPQSEAAALDDRLR